MIASPIDALARGYQDPHFVEAKPSFILKLQKADLLIVVGRELEVGWLPPLIQQSRNAKIQAGAEGYLDASAQARILDIPQGQITRAMGDVHPSGNPHYWLDPENGKVIARDIAAKLAQFQARRQGLFRSAPGRVQQPRERGHEAMAGGDGAVQGGQGGDLSPVVSRTSPIASASTWSVTSSRARGFRLLRVTRWT